MTPQDLVYLVSIVNVDTHDVRYVCDSETKAMGMFEELRKECIAECEEAIQYHFEEDHNLSCIPHEQEKLAFLKTMQPKDIPPWCCDRPTIEVFPFLRSRRDIPTSKELIQLAHADFKNREERKGLHDQSSWTSGWITGFLSERKPNWGKEREEKVRKEERETIFNDINERWTSQERSFKSGLTTKSHMWWVMGKYFESFREGVKK